MAYQDGLLQPKTDGVNLSSTQGVVAPQQAAPRQDFTSQYTNTAPEETVESRLTNLLKRDNPYLASARSGAMQQANSRGLLNTSIAAGAGESAAIQSALPIAQQDAGFYQNRNLAGQQGEIQSSLSAQQANQQKGLYETQGAISSRLAEQEFGHQKQLSMQEYAQQRGLAELGYKHEKEMKDADMAWNKIDLNARMQVEYDRLSQENKARFDQTSNAISEQYQKDLLEVLLNPHFKTKEDRQAAIDNLNYLTEQRMTIASKIAGVTLSWSAPTKSPVYPTKPPFEKIKPKTITNNKATKTTSSDDDRWKDGWTGG